jgi:hypothetical protein
MTGLLRHAADAEAVRCACEDCWPGVVNNTLCMGLEHVCARGAGGVVLFRPTPQQIPLINQSTCYLFGRPIRPAIPFVYRPGLLTYRSTCYSTGRRGLIIPGLASPARRRSVLRTAYPAHFDNIFDRANSASSSRNMGLKTSTASTNVQLRRMAKSWGTAGARSRSDTLPKRHTLARARGGEYTAVV